MTHQPSSGEHSVSVSSSSSWDAWSSKDPWSSFHALPVADAVPGPMPHFADLRSTTSMGSDAAFSVREHSSHPPQNSLGFQGISPAASSVEMPCILPQQPMVPNNTHLSIANLGAARSLLGSGLASHSVGPSMGCVHPMSQPASMLGMGSVTASSVRMPAQSFLQPGSFASAELTWSNHTQANATSPAAGRPMMKRSPGRPRKYPLVSTESTPGLSERDKAMPFMPDLDHGPHLKSRLRPPKQPLTAWQFFFTDELHKLKAKSPNESLNVAQLSKEAGQRYAALPNDVKQTYVQRGQEAREKYEKELAAWQASLTPEDVRLENVFRSTQRRLGKSRRGNMRDPNAPKKPPSAYFLYLQAIRASPEKRDDILHGEHDSSKQSVLAAAKWRSMSAEEKRPFQEQAVRDKAEYERQRRAYEQRHYQPDNAYTPHVVSQHTE